MTGILSRYLSGTGTDPLAQQGGMEGYLNQFNVNPYWQQYLQKGEQPSGLLGTLAQQQYTQGGQNPYAQGQNAYQTPTAPAAESKGSPYQVTANTPMRGIEFNMAHLNPLQQQQMKAYAYGNASTGKNGMIQQYQVPAALLEEIEKSPNNGTEQDYLRNELIKRLTQTGA
jgi:hypothetical protein